MTRKPASKISFAEYEKRDEERFVADYTHLLERHGYVYATDIPDGFDHLRLLARFGEFYPGPSGKLVDDVVPEAGMNDVYYGGNQRALLPHTEGYEFAALPPRFLALWCVVPASGEGGETTLFDARELIDRLEPGQRTYLETEVFDFQASEGLIRRGLGERSSHPVLQEVDGTRLLRFSCNNIRLPGPDAPVSLFLDHVRQAFEAGSTAVRYRRNDILQWDNWRVLHSRNAFGDQGRHLKRVQIRAGSPVAQVGGTP